MQNLFEEVKKILGQPISEITTSSGMLNGYQLMHKTIEQFARQIYQLFEQPPSLTAKTDPVLAEIWNNRRDAAYEKMDIPEEARLVKLYALILAICRDKYAIPEMMAERIIKGVDNFIFKTRPLIEKRAREKLIEEIEKNIFNLCETCACKESKDWQNFKDNKPPKDIRQALKNKQ